MVVGEHGRSRMLFRECSCCCDPGHHSSWSEMSVVEVKSIAISDQLLAWSVPGRPRALPWVDPTYRTPLLLVVGSDKLEEITTTLLYVSLYVSSNTTTTLLDVHCQILWDQGIAGSTAHRIIESLDPVQTGPDQWIQWSLTYAVCLSVL